MSPRPLRAILGALTLALGTMSLGIAVYALTSFVPPAPTIQARLLPENLRPDTVPWKVFTPDMLTTGFTLPADTHVIIQLPPDRKPILRDVLFGTTNDTKTRYWGYCLPENYQKETAVNTDILPGKVFLSEGEQQARTAAYAQTLRSNFSLSRDLTEENLNGTKTAPQGLIYSQFMTFDPGAICYVMSERPLATGMDDDDDGANNMVERNYHSDPRNPDTDGDGLNDGCEIFGLKTSPLLRDTDGDGLIDGVEDANHNCHYDAGTETNPLAWDTDNDGLPDGLMKMGDFRNTRLMGEDKNLNGKVDPGETDPKKWSTAGDGTSDGDRYWQCIFAGQQGC